MKTVYNLLYFTKPGAGTRALSPGLSRQLHIRQAKWRENRRENGINPVRHRSKRAESRGASGLYTVHTLQLFILARALFISLLSRSRSIPVPDERDKILSELILSSFFIRRPVGCVTWKNRRGEARSATVVTQRRIGPRIHRENDPRSVRLDYPVP